jgi:WD40 repeat protein
MLTELEGADNSVTSLAWSGDGSFLSIGCNDNNVQLWSVEAKKQLRTMRGHQARVGALAWNNHVLTSGSRCVDKSDFFHLMRVLHCTHICISRIRSLSSPATR